MYHWLVDLLHPVTLLFLLIAVSLVGLWLSRSVPRRRLWLLTVAVLLLAAYCTPAVAFWVTRLLEGRYPPVEDRPANVNAIVVLGGGVTWPGPGDRETRPNDSTLRRCFRAAELYRQGAPCPVFVIGGFGRPDRPGQPEAEVMRRSLLAMGLPAETIVLGAASRNTYENAAEAKRLMTARESTTAALVTDAVHLTRAVGCFRRQGVDVVPIGASYRARYLDPTVFSFVPRARAAHDNQLVFHELLGLLWYWWKDRI